MERTDVLLECPVCSEKFGAEESKSVPYQTEKFFTGAQRPRSICFCPKCGVGVGVPVLNDEKISELYSEGGYWGNSDFKIFLPKYNPGHYALAKARWSFVEPFLQKKSISILDIGAGHGFFGIAALESRAIALKEYCAIEQDVIFQGSLKRTWGRHFPQVKLQVEESLEKITGKYDLIIFSHILEHLYHPKDMLKIAVEKLAEDGLLFIDLPNQDYIFKRDVFPHVLFFNISCLKQLFQKSELNIKSISCYGRDMDRSPMHYKNEKKTWKQVEKVVYKARYILPLTLSTAFFDWYLGGNKQNSNGTWIRAVVQKSPIN